MPTGVGRKICVLFAAILLTVLFGLYVHGWLEALQAPLPIGYEGANLYIATQLEQGKNIYDSATLFSPPWSVTIHGPIFYCVLASFQKLFGVNYWSGRLISILSLIAVVVCSYKLFRAGDLSRMLSGAVLALFLSYNTTWNWSFLGRVDMLSMAFSIAALERFLTIYNSLERAKPIEKQKLKAVDSRKGKSASDTAGDGGSSFVDACEIYMLPVILSVAAIFVKQSSVVVPAAISIFLIARGRIREGLAFGGLSGLMCIALVLIINHSTEGGFLLHLRYLCEMPFQFGEPIVHVQHLKMIGLDSIKLCIVPLLAVSWYLTRKDAADDSYIGLPLILTVLAGAMAIFTLSEFANSNHAFQFFFAVSWLSGHLSRSLPVECGIAMCTVSSALVLFIWYVSFGSQQVLFGLMHEPMQETVRKLRSMKHPGAVVFTEDPALAMEMGARPLFVDVATFVQVWKKDGGPMKELLDAIQKRKYAAVIINDNDLTKQKERLYWSDDLIDTVRSNYQIKNRILGNRQPHDYCLPMQPVQQRAN